MLHSINVIIPKLEPYLTLVLMLVLSLETVFSFTMPYNFFYVESQT